MHTELPRIPVDLLANKWKVLLGISPVLLGSFIIPMVIYFVLTYATSVKLAITLGVAMGVFGAATLPGLIISIWRLTARFDRFAPVGATSKWTLDLFTWNFIVGFIYLTVVITISTSLDPPVLSLSSLSLPILMLHVCGEILVAQAARAAGLRAPFRLSSLPRGSEITSACDIIAEDICAVHAAQGREFRRQWRARWGASPVWRRLFCRLDLLWGFSGVVVAAAIFVVVLVVDDKSVGFGVGWTAPWVWAFVTGMVTWAMAKRALSREHAEAKTNAGGV